MILTSKLPARGARPRGAFRLCLSAAFALAPLTGLAAAGGIVRHAPALGGEIQGSIQVLSAEDLALAGRARVSADLLVPGEPVVRLQGGGAYGTLANGAGAATPTTYTLTLSGSAFVNRIVQHTDPVSLVPVAPPATPTGTRSIAINSPSDSLGDPATLRNLTLNGNAGSVALPPGTYGTLTVHGSSRLVLGTGGSTVAVYQLQELVLDGSAALVLDGPVRLVLASSFVVDRTIGSVTAPDSLQLDFAGGSGLILNGGARVYARLNTPGGQFTLRGNTEFTGTFAADRLSLDQNAVLRLGAVTVNQPPVVALTAPADGSRFANPVNLTLAATASDPDGSIARVEFFDNGTLLATDSSAPYDYAWAAVPIGTHVLTTRAYDDAGAFTTSAPTTIQVTQNAAPQVVLVTPANGANFASPANLQLVATATDSDGTIGRVEFLDTNDVLVGTVNAATTPPDTYAFTASFPPGTHVLKARAYDNSGAFTDSSAATIRVYPGLPYVAGFEPSEGYQLGLLGGQLGWRTPQGTAQIQSGGAASGLQAVSVPPGSPVARVQQDFIANPAGVVFAEVFAKPPAEAALGTTSVIETDQSRVGLLRVGSQGQVWVYDGALAAWKATDIPVALPLAVDGRPADWVRLTVREDFVAKTWDLYVNGALKAVNIGFRSPALSSFSTFAVTGHATVPAGFDDVFIGHINPLFVDQDGDGIDDAYEIANGLDPTRNDRNEDRDGDGLTNIQEYLRGTRANLADTDGDGLGDGWEVRYNFNPLVPDSAGDRDGDGLTNLEEQAAGTNPNSSDTDGDGLPDAWEVRYGLDPLTNSAAGDADGDGVSNFVEFLQGRNPTKGAIPDPGVVNLNVIRPTR